MEISEAIRQRKSIRGYKPDPVPREILKKIIETAMRSPSAMNTQPWEITVITGEVLNKIKQENIKELTSGAQSSPDIWRKPYEGIYRQRQVDLAIQIFELMGITREDKEKRAKWLERGFRFFGAPAAIIISMDASLQNTFAMFDLGTLCQSICLSALEYGLGTCIEDQGIKFPEVLRKHSGILGSKQIVIGITIGYPDWDFPANKLVSKREPVENITTWHGFD